MSKRKIPYPVTDAEDAAIRRLTVSDRDAPEQTDAELSEFRPAQEVLPEVFDAGKATVNRTTRLASAGEGEGGRNQ